MCRAAALGRFYLGETQGEMLPLLACIIDLLSHVGKFSLMPIFGSLLPLRIPVTAGRRIRCRGLWELLIALGFCINVRSIRRHEEWLACPKLLERGAPWLSMREDQELCLAPETRAVWEGCFGKEIRKAKYIFLKGLASRTMQTWNPKATKTIQSAFPQGDFASLSNLACSNHEDGPNLRKRLKRMHG